MEEIEVPVEQVQEHIHEAAHHSGVRWIGYVALSSAILAVFAAIAALLAGHHANEAMLTQIKASDRWGYYQAKGIKSAVLETRISVLQAMGKTVSEKDLEKSGEYKKEQEEISKEATELQHESDHNMDLHQILARAVTMFQVAIAIGAVSALTRRRKFWFVSLGFGFFGVLFLIQSFFAH